MKASINLILSIICSFIVLPASASYNSRPLPNALPQEEFPLGWQSFEKGVLQAKKEKKHVLIQFFDPNCVDCQKMGGDVISDPSLDDAIRKHFVLIRVNRRSERTLPYRGKRISEQDFVKKHQITQFPTLMFLSPQGQLIGRYAGYIEPAALSELLTGIATKNYAKVKMI